MSFLFLKIQVQLEEAQSDSSKERKLRERAEVYSRELEQELEALKQRPAGRSASLASLDPAQEVTRSVLSHVALPLSHHNSIFWTRSPSFNQRSGPPSPPLFEKEYP